MAGATDRGVGRPGARGGQRVGEPGAPAPGRGSGRGPVAAEHGGRADRLRNNWSSRRTRKIRTEPARYVDRWEIRQIWHVRADYVLENLTDGEIKARSGSRSPGTGGGGLRLRGRRTGHRLRAANRAAVRDLVSRAARRDRAEHRQVDNECPSAGQDGGAAPDAGTSPAGACYPFLFVFRWRSTRTRGPLLTVEYDQRPFIIDLTERKKIGAGKRTSWNNINKILASRLEHPGSV